jgi:nucleotide-binding universal stress UspA family protein
MYKKIMVPLDGSELAESVLPHVKALIKAFNIKVVILARVVEPTRYSRSGEDAFNPEDMQKWDASRKSSARDYLEKIAKRFKHEGTTVHCEVFVGKVTENLIDYAEQNGIDLIIMATHGRSGVSRWVLGSVADKLLRSASVPVLMIRAHGAKGEI